MQESVEKLGLTRRQVITIRQDKSAYEAFQVVKEKKLSALPVVDSEGRVIGCISSDDIKQLGFDMRFFGILQHSLIEYFDILKTQNVDKSEPYDGELAIPRPAVVSVLPTQDLRRVLRLATLYEIHRVFVAEAQGKLLGVITLKDILQVLFKEQRS